MSYNPLTKGMISSQVVPKNPTFDPKMSRKTQTPSSTQATPNSKLGMDWTNLPKKNQEKGE